MIVPAVAEDPAGKFHSTPSVPPPLLALPRPYLLRSGMSLITYNSTDFALNVVTTVPSSDVPPSGSEIPTIIKSDLGTSEIWPPELIATSAPTPRSIAAS